MALRQENRLLGMKTPLGEDVLLLTALDGREAISQLFHFRLEMISDRPSISAGAIVGKNVTFSVKLADGSSRHFNGFVSRFFAGDEDPEGRRNYRAEVVPWLWFLIRRSDCRIFQNKTAPEIIEQVFQDAGFSDYEVSQIKGEHPKRDYCVQYRESDFQFVSRLMEQEGIFYYFRHEEGKHTLVLADHKGAYRDCGEKEVDYPRDTRARAVRDHLTAWEHRYEFRSGKFTQTDYNFEDHPARGEPTPAKLLISSKPSVVRLENAQKYELYDYPGEYEDKAAGQSLAQVRIEEEELEHDVVEATSTCRTFFPGGKFKIGAHRSSSEEGKGFVITSVRHRAAEPMAYETGAAVAAEDYGNSFTCIPDSVAFRPPRQTPKPVVQGVQTAVVVGPPGEEIWPDKYGRVKVQFFWDRQGKRDENSSCWIRVSQAYAGKSWGAMCVPRIGQEVIVDFLEGNPDRPIVTGRVYNADQMPPYDLPASKTISGLKSNSSPGGGGYNELILDDTKGEELIRLHAQYDMDSTIEHDLREHVLNDRSRDVTNDETVTVGNDQKLQIGAKQETTVGDSQDLTVGNNQTTNVSNDQSLSVGGSQEITVGGSQDLSLGNSLSIMAGTSIKLTVGGSSIEIGPSNIKISSAGVVEITGSLVKIN